MVSKKKKKEMKLLEEQAKRYLDDERHDRMQRANGNKHNPFEGMSYKERLILTSM